MIKCIKYSQNFGICPICIFLSRKFYYTNFVLNNFYEFIFCFLDVKKCSKLKSACIINFKKFLFQCTFILKILSISLLYSAKECSKVHSVHFLFLFENALQFYAHHTYFLIYFFCSNKLHQIFTKFWYLFLGKKCSSYLENFSFKKSLLHCNFILNNFYEFIFCFLDVKKCSKLQSACMIIFKKFLFPCTFILKILSISLLYSTEECSKVHSVHFLFLFENVMQFYAHHTYFLTLFLLQ